MPVPNYTINKGTLAENMATAAIEYPFALAETMGGNVSTARVLAMGPLKILGVYRTWQEDWKNYSGEDWWKAQGINLVGAVGVKVSTGIFTGMRGYAYSRNPYIATGIGVVGAMVADIESDPIIEDMK